LAKEKKPGLSKKTVNNHLTVLRRILVVAKKRGLLDGVPEIEWLRAPKPDFDFLDFDEADRLVKAADGEWRWMILIGLRTGLRQGELLALRWEDVDLKTGLLRVRQSVTRGHVTEPKSGKGRDVPLSDDAVVAFKTQRHLRGPLVFCDQDGKMLVKTECKWPLWRACQRAGLRRISWHVLRHSFASHLAMRGVPLKVVQELLGHATMDMTMRYAHLSPNIPREAVKALDGSAVAPTWHRRSNLSNNAGQVAVVKEEKIVEAPGVEPRRAMSVSIRLDRFWQVFPSLTVKKSKAPHPSR
jgi:integrase